MAMESLTVLTIMIGDKIDFKRVRQARRPYSNDALMIPFRGKELGTGVIIVEEDDLQKLLTFNFRSEYNLIKFATEVANASYENRFEPLKYSNQKFIELHVVKDEVIIFRLKMRGRDDIIFSIKPMIFEHDGTYKFLDRVTNNEDKKEEIQLFKPIE